jgi:hypothetical protein
MGTEGKRPTITCPLCGHNNSKVFYELTNTPCNCNVLWKSRQDAINCPKGDIVLAFCPSCTYIANYSVEAEKNRYDKSYDNSLFYSSLFNRYVEKTVRELIQRFNLHQKTIMEITVGKVDFLSLFCSMGNNKGIVFNPAEIIDEESCENLLKKIQSKIDFVFSFHDLEHANNPRKSLKILEKVAKENMRTTFYFSVPNIYKAFSAGDFTDIMYEHVSYFTLPSLSYLFNSCGYKMLDVYPDTGGLYDSIDVVASVPENTNILPQIPSQTDSEAIQALTRQFASKATTVIDKANSQIKQLLDQGKRIVVWGAGARGVTLLNILKDDRIQYVVDINPNKKGHFIPGTAQEIVAPNFLVSYQPDYVFIINAVYKQEIESNLRELNVKSYVLTLEY